MAPSREHGFSLIELMIVVALVAVLVGTTVPAMAGAMRRYELTTTSQQVVSTIRAARLQAVGRNRVLRVRFDFPAAGQYQVVDALDNAIGLVQSLADGVTFGAFTDVQFSTSGRLAAPIVITVGNGNQTNTINVSASGQVRLQ